MQISYSKLFTIELLHEYSRSGKSTEFELQPSEDTEAVFRGLNIEWRSYDNLFSCFIRENENGEPFLNTPPGKTFRVSSKEVIFRLYLKLRKPGFLNYTNLSSASFAQERLLFSNMAGNNRNNTLYLSKKIDDVGTGGYVPGDLVMKTPGGEVFEALKKQAAGGVKPLSNTDFWAPKGKRQYPTYKQDGIRYTSGTYIFDLSTSSKKAEVAIRKYNFDAAALAYDVPARQEETQFFEEPTAKVPVSFSDLAPGKYLVEVNGESRFVYYDPVLERENVFALIEVYNHLPDTSPYALLDADEKIRGVRYVLQFPNRKVLWKYTRKNNKAAMLKDTSGTYTFTLQGEDFVSTTPIPLSEAGVKTLELSFTNPAANHPLSPLPTPAGNLLTRFEQDGYAYLCSGMYLNH